MPASACEWVMRSPFVLATILDDNHSPNGQQGFIVRSAYSGCGAPSCRSAGCPHSADARVPDTLWSRKLSPDEGAPALREAVNIFGSRSNGRRGTSRHARSSYHRAAFFLLSREKSFFSG